MADVRVLWHRYDTGTTTDLSGAQHHGVPEGVEFSGQPPMGLRFESGQSGVWVAASSTLSTLGTVRLGCRFTVGFDAPARRLNLVEAQLCFAFFVTPDRALVAGIFNGEQWSGLQTPSGVILPGRQHEATFAYNGYDRIGIGLDGAVLADARTAQGPLATVGANGLAIGRWPEKDDRYTFSGVISEVVLYAFDPAQTLVDLAASPDGKEEPPGSPSSPRPPGLQTHTVAAVVRELQEAGVTGAELRSVVHELLAISTLGYASAAGGPDAVSNLAQRIIDSAVRGAPSFDVAAEVNATWSSTAQKEGADRLLRALSHVPLTGEQAARLLTALGVPAPGGMEEFASVVDRLNGRA